MHDNPQRWSNPRGADAAMSCFCLGSPVSTRTSLTPWKRNDTGQTSPAAFAAVMMVSHFCCSNVLRPWFALPCAFFGLSNKRLSTEKKCLDPNSLAKVSEVRNRKTNSGGCSAVVRQLERVAGAHVRDDDAGTTVTYLSARLRPGLSHSLLQASRHHATTSSQRVAPHPAGQF